MATARCVIFDLGNVIALFDKNPVWAGLAELAERRVSAEGARDRVVNSGLEQQFDRGHISTHTFLTRICEELGLVQGKKAQIASLWQNVFKANTPVIELITKLRQQPGYRLLLASNTNELHFQTISVDFREVLRLFDSMILSFKIGYVKPEKEFFEQCIEAARCDAARCVYVDDQWPFCKAARVGFGIEAVCYSQGVDLETLLGNLGDDQHE
jgi:putative hydrolase of the HAD superfamily